MNGLFDAATEIQDFCRDRQWRFCLIGGMAVQRWGEPRQTRDVDLTLLTGFGGEAPFTRDHFRRQAPLARGSGGTEPGCFYPNDVGWSPVSPRDRRRAARPVVRAVSARRRAPMANDSAWPTTISARSARLIAV